MKHLVFTILVVFNLFATKIYSQENNQFDPCSCKKIPCKNGKYIYESTVKVDSVSAEELNKRARLFFSKVFYNETQIVIDDVQNNSITAKALVNIVYRPNILFAYDVKVRFIFTIQTKEGKFRYSFSDIKVDYYTEPGKPTNVHVFDDLEHFMSEWTETREDEFVPKMNQAFVYVIKELNKNMLIPTTSEDW